jgi:hypothetical protein
VCQGAGQSGMHVKFEMKGDSGSSWRVAGKLFAAITLRILIPKSLLSEWAAL